MTTLPPPMLAEPLHRSNGVSGGRRRQRGVALLAMLTLLTLVGLYLFVGQLSAMQPRIAREQESAALAEAMTALISDAIARSSIYSAGYLRLPDLGSRFGISTEGEASTTFPGDGTDLSVVGKFPWKTLDIAPRLDDQGGCLWYVVSGRFKIAPPTGAFNWDTQGQIDMIDGGGQILATNLAAVLVAPGRALDGQSRVLADAVYSECGGNYDARNYLDSFDSADAIGGQVNYFAGSTNNRVAPNTSNKRFVIADNDHYNDRFVFITVDQIFDPLIRRRDFAAAIGTLAPSDDPTGRLLDDPIFQEHLKTIAISGSKGTDNLKCGCKNPPVCTLPARGDSFQDFCENWKEMLFITQLSTPSRILLDGAPSLLVCNRVLIFAGRKTSGQSRSTGLDKTQKSNYLEGTNASSFNVPTASAVDFNGTSTFDYRNSSADILRCLP